MQVNRSQTTRQPQERKNTQQSSNARSNSGSQNRTNSQSTHNNSQNRTSSQNRTNNSSHNNSNHNQSTQNRTSSNSSHNSRSTSNSTNPFSRSNSNSSESNSKNRVNNNSQSKNTDSIFSNKSNNTNNSNNTNITNNTSQSKNTDSIFSNNSNNTNGTNNNNNNNNTDSIFSNNSNNTNNSNNSANGNTSNQDSEILNALNTAKDEMNSGTNSNSQEPATNVTSDGVAHTEYEGKSDNEIAEMICNKADVSVSADSNSSVELQRNESNEITGMKVTTYDESGKESGYSIYSHDGKLESTTNLSNNADGITPEAPESASLGVCIVGGSIVDSFDGNTKDGTIGDTQQGATGDCWLLSAVNSLSYTEEGSKAINNALTYHDGYTTVHLTTGDYIVSDDEVTTTKGSFQYADGDDDMIILELATEKALDDIANGNVQLKEDSPWYTKNDVTATKSFSSSANGNYEEMAWYLLTGKTSERYGISDASEDIDNALNEYQNNNGKDIALTCDSNTNNDISQVQGIRKNIFGTYLVTDVNGKEHKFSKENHAYAVKSVTDSTVTITNPWNSGDEITITREQYKKLFVSTQKIDLSDNNTKRDCITYNVKDENGQTQNYENRYIKYSDNGKVEWISYDRYDENGNKFTAFDTNNDGITDQYHDYKTGKHTYNVADKKGKIYNYEASYTKYSDDGNVEWVSYDRYDENGNKYTAFDTNNDGIIDQYFDCQTHEYTVI